MLIDFILTLLVVLFLFKLGLLDFFAILCVIIAIIMLLQVKL